MRVALIVDNPARDLDGLVLVARALAARGASALLVPMYQQGIDLPLLAPDAVVVNFVRAANVDLLRAYRALGIRTVVLDTEGGILSSRGANAPATWARRFRDAGHGELVDLHCFWGPALAEAFVAEGALPESRIRVTGCPRFDFCFPPWRASLARPEHGYVLVNTNFSAVNPRFARGGERAALIAAGWEPGYVDTLLGEIARAHEGYLAALDALAAALGDAPLIVRPHPFERAELYRERLAGRANVRVDPSGDVLSRIANARCVVHLNCGTSVEAVMLRRPPLAMEFLNTDFLRRHSPLPSAVSAPMASLDALVAAARDPAPVDAARPYAELYDRHIRPWFHLADGKAAERVAAAALEAASGAAPRRGLARALAGGRPAPSAAQRLQGALGVALGTSTSAGLRALLDPRRRAKSFTPAEVESSLRRIDAAEGSGAAARVAPARHPLTGARLASIEVAPA